MSITSPSTVLSSVGVSKAVLPMMVMVESSSSSSYGMYSGVKSGDFPCVTDSGISWSRIRV